MAEPEKEPNDPLEEPAPTVPPKIEILSDIDEYQDRIESQWESTKVNYQDKINKILDEFIQQNLHNPQAPPDLKSEPRKPPPINPTPSSADINSEVRLERLLKRAEKVMGMAGAAGRFKSPPPPINPFQLEWNANKSWLGRIWQHKYIVGGALLLCGGSVALWMTFKSPLSARTLPYTHATGLIVEDQKIYIVDWFRKALYVHGNKQNLPILSVENLPNQFMTGFAKSPNKFWTIDGLTQEILEHTATADHLVTRKIHLPGKKPTGLYYDGMDLWSMDDESKKLYRHRGNDPDDIKETFTLPSMSVSSLVVIKNRLWVLSEKSRMIIEFRLEDPVRELRTYDLDPYLDGSKVTSFSIDGKSLWLTTINPTRLVRVPMTALRS